MNAKPSLLPERIRQILGKASRLDALSSTGIDGAEADRRFDQIAAQAAMIFSAPVAQVNFLEEHRQIIPASPGFPITESPTETSFCAHALEMVKEPIVVLDASKDKRFANNPFVAGQPNIRFYCGCPIVLDGENIGTVCVYDFEPRQQITSEQNEALIAMAEDASAIAKAKHGTETDVRETD